MELHCRQRPSGRHHLHDRLGVFRCRSPARPGDIHRKPRATPRPGKSPLVCRPTVRAHAA